MRSDRYGEHGARVGGTADSNEKSMMCLTFLFALGVDSVSWEEDWRDIT